jgi:hypothetical protein
VLIGGVLSAVSGCGLVPESAPCDDAAPPIAEGGLSPIQRGLRFLEATQYVEDNFTSGRMAYAGDWPQCFALSQVDLVVRDVSPFMPAFVHHALSLVHEETQAALGLTAQDVDSARAIRGRTVELILRFAGDPNGPEAGTFGFWPAASADWMPGVFIARAYLTSVIDGVMYDGTRAPPNFAIYPRVFAIYPDADDTAAAYTVLTDDARLDGGAAVTTDVAGIFSAWRDLGDRPQLNDAPWIPRPSGAYLTWLANGEDPADPAPNDLDLPVNVNVLYALGRFERLDAPGVVESIAWINDAVTLHGVHLTAADALSLYYPDNLSFHYFVTRAWREGGVTELSPAVDALVDELLDTARVDGAGRVFWDRGAPVLNTAFATLALINAGAGEELVAPANEFLMAQQDTETGAWPAELFFIGELDPRIRAEWSSAAFTTAMVLEALCRARIANGN